MREPGDAGARASLPVPSSQGGPRVGPPTRLGPSAPVAQLDRASVYGTEGQRFESSRARSKLPANDHFYVTVQSLVSITRSACNEGESWGVERSEAEAIYEAGKERCVEFILELAQALEQLTVANAA